MMALADFHFLRPWWLLAVLLLPLLGWAWRRQSRSAGAWGEFVDAHLLPHLIEQAPAHRHNAAAWLAAMAWMIACLALAGPATVIPLALFAWSARRLPLSAVGFLQFIAPTLQFLLGVAFGEAFTPLRALSFVFIWLGVATFAYGAWKRTRALA